MNITLTDDDVKAVEEEMQKGAKKTAATHFVELKSLALEALSRDQQNPSVLAAILILKGKSTEAFALLGLTGPTTTSDDTPPDFIDVIDTLNGAVTKIDTVRRTNQATLEHYKSQGFTNEVREHGHVIELRKPLAVTHDDPELPVYDKRGAGRKELFRIRRSEGINDVTLEDVNGGPDHMVMYFVRKPRVKFGRS